MNIEFSSHTWIRKNTSEVIGMIYNSGGIEGIERYMSHDGSKRLMKDLGFRFSTDVYRSCVCSIHKSTYVIFEPLDANFETYVFKVL
jgi:hypothetical protein